LKKIVIVTKGQHIPGLTENNSFPMMKKCGWSLVVNQQGVVGRAAPKRQRRLLDCLTVHDARSFNFVFRGFIDDQGPAIWLLPTTDGCSYADCLP
jgi:hypothetical protein